MAQYNHLPIFQSVYRLTLEIYRVVRRFPGDHKYGLGQRLKEIVSDLLNLIIAANSEEKKTQILKTARLRLEQIRIHLRLANDLGILGLKKYESFNQLLEEISKQLSGWYEWSVSHK